MPVVRMLCADAVVNHLKHLGVFFLCLLSGVLLSPSLDQGLNFNFTKNPVVMHVLECS